MLGDAHDHDPHHRRSAMQDAPVQRVLRCHVGVHREGDQRAGGVAGQRHAQLVEFRNDAEERQRAERHVHELADQAQHPIDPGAVSPVEVVMLGEGGRQGVRARRPFMRARRRTLVTSILTVPLKPFTSSLSSCAATSRVYRPCGRPTSRSEPEPRHRACQYGCFHWGGQLRTGGRHPAHRSRWTLLQARDP